MNSRAREAEKKRRDFLVRLLVLPRSLIDDETDSAVEFGLKSKVKHETGLSLAKVLLLAGTPNKKRNGKSTYSIYLAVRKYNPRKFCHDIKSSLSRKKS